jgi:hypothetical protein
MEIFIGFLLLVVGGIVFVAFKFLSDDDKRTKSLEDAKGKRIADLEVEVGQKDTELKKALAEVQRIEEEFYKAKDEADIAKKDVSELQAKLKSLEKERNEVVDLKNNLKLNDQMLQQETLARQKLQGELSLKDSEVDQKAREVEQFRKEAEKIAIALKDKDKLLEGLKGQYNELEGELQKIKMAQPQETPKASIASEASEMHKPAESSEAPGPVKVPWSSQINEMLTSSAALKASESDGIGEMLKASGSSEPPKAPVVQEAPKSAVPPKASKPLKAFEPIEPLKPQPPASAEVKINQGFGFTKAELRQGVPSDTDFLKASSPQKPAEVTPEIPDGTFKLTNVNKPQGTVPVDEKKDKSKSKRETLVPGFQPKEKSLPETPQ